MSIPPLQGLRVLDLARVLACPFSAMILAELGAEVIKVEQPGSGDESRSYEPVAERNGQRDSAYFFACNRGKRSVTVNLRHKDGQALVRDLIRHCDAVVENFPTGTLKRYGLDWEALRAINPRLVMLSCTGFGQTGPYAKRKGYDTVFQAMSGLMALTGERGGGPVKPGLPIADLTSGLWITIGLLAALRGRDATGQGAYIDFSMLMGRWRCSPPPPRASLPWARYRRVLARNIQAACRPLPFAVPMGGSCISPVRISIGRRFVVRLAWMNWALMRPWAPMPNVWRNVGV